VSLQPTAATGLFGVADATARSLVTGVARQPGLGTMHPFVSGVRRAYQRLPESARGPAVTSAFGWAKAYVSSPAFATVYAAARAQAKPTGLPTYDLSVDQEVQQELDRKLADLEESKKGIGFIPEADRPRFLAALKEAEDQVRDPSMRQFLRNEIEGRRGADARGTNEAAERWNATYPADVRVFVRQELERFLVASSDIDFTIPITLIKNPAGAIVGFVAPIDRLFKSWMEAECMMAGNDMVAAARAATEAWLKELPR
jgi:hypothetical protein